MEMMGGTGLKECHRRSPISPAKFQSILMKDHLMRTAEIVLNADFF